MNKVEIKNLLLECISMWKNEDASEDWTDYEMIGLDKLEVLYKCFDFDPEWKDCNDAYTCQSCDLPIFTNSVSVWTNHIIKREHIESTNGDLSQLECEHCGEDFDTTIQLKKHAKTRKCEYYRTCSYCKETSGSKFTYEQHKGDGKCHVEKLVEKSKATI